MRLTYINKRLLTCLLFTVFVTLRPKAAVLCPLGKEYPKHKTIPSRYDDYSVLSKIYRGAGVIGCGDRRVSLSTLITTMCLRQTFYLFICFFEAGTARNFVFGVWMDYVAY